jgi:Domain of unknown function (DUF4351)
MSSEGFSDQQGLKLEQELVLRVITRKVGAVPQELRSRIELLSVDRLEALAEALIDFDSLQDLQNWLEIT